MRDEQGVVSAGTIAGMLRRALTRAAALALILLLIVVVVSPRASASENIALVVGNSDYRKVVQLPNPANDAADMAASLQRLGFSVKLLTNLDYDGFRRALIEFGNAAKSADKAVFFYAGHGMEVDGKNWLIPVDAEMKSEINVYAEAINLETLIDISVMPKIIGLVVLDACRDNPFTGPKVASGRSVAGSISATDRPSAEAEVPRVNPEPVAGAAGGFPAMASQGLAPVEVSDNVLVAFAAAAGTTARDGLGRNSPYSESLLRHVEIPGLEVNYLFRDVHDEVLKETTSQEPALYGTLSSQEVFLSGGAPQNVVEVEADAEKVAWSYVRSTSEVATLRRFADQFPKSGHLTEARERIAQIEDAEGRAWSIAERQHSPAAYRGFLEIYPYSEHVEGARVTLASLENSQKSGHEGEANLADLPKPPAADSVPASSLGTAKSPQAVEMAWAVLKESRDPAVVTQFATKYPSQRQKRLPPGSDFALRRSDPTEWMLRTAQDEDVNACFLGNAGRCAQAIEKYPDYAQLQFQLCRAKGNPGDCMKDSVEEARRRGLLVSAYTRSESEKIRNAEYRVAVARVDQKIGNVVGDTVNSSVGNVVNTAVSRAAGDAASGAASGAAGSAASNAAGGAVSSAAVTAAPGAAVTVAPGTGGRAAPGAAASAIPAGTAVVVAPRMAGRPGAAASVGSGAAGRAASGAAGRAASGAAGRAASGAAGRAASQAAGRAAGQAASHAASHAAARAAARAAAESAGRAASDAAANAASRAVSDVRLKRDVVRLGYSAQGLGLYRYRYLDDEVFYVGVMAQEVVKQFPSAVSRRSDGYLEVDYGSLGLQFVTYREWLRRRSHGLVNAR